MLLAIVIIVVGALLQLGIVAGTGGRLGFVELSLTLVLLLPFLAALVGVFWLVRRITGRS